MRWHCFLFWCGYRLTLALLAHFNWSTSIYVNCVYFVLWKSYDLLWFWMHLVLCICFKPLRTKNYLIVWCNLIHKRITVHPNSTYKEIYMFEYRKSQKLRKQRSDKLDETETSDCEQGEQDSDNGSQDIDTMEVGRVKSNELNSRNLKITGVKSVAALAPDVEECQCIKQTWPNLTQSNANISRQDHHNDAPIPPPRLKKQMLKSREEQIQETDSHIPTRWNQFDIRDMILKSLKSSKQIGYCAPCGKKRHSLDDAVGMASNEISNASDAGSQVGRAVRILRHLPFVQGNRDSSTVEDGMDILTADFTNKRSATGADEILLREKHDRRMLKKRLQAQKRAELAIIAKYEAKQKTISMAVELLLQILQMMASFAILVGNIRRTFIPAHFSWRKHGHNDSMELMLLWRCTVFLDVLLFWIAATWTYCMQWHLCCRLGLMKFWMWLLILGLVGGLFVLYPMLYVQDNLDISWCQFKPNSTLAQYQPNW